MRADRSKETGERCVKEIAGGMDLEGIMLCEVNQTEKDKHCMISPLCGIVTNAKLVDIENGVVVTRCGVWGLARWVRVIKRYKLPVIRQISPGNVTYSMTTIVNNTVLYIGKFLRE